MADGSYGTSTTDGNPLGLLYTLNFSTPFNVSQNISDVLVTISKTGSGLATNLAPNYFDGALLANDDEFYLYGGLLAEDDAYTPPDADEVLKYEGYQYSVDKPAWKPQFLEADLTGNLTRYIAYGGAANVPSENKAFYFSGMQSPDHGPVYYPSGNESLTAVNVSNTLITLDLSAQRSEKWSNVTLPSSIPGRANPELVWVPVGSEGILVALGGVVYPDFDNDIFVSENETASEDESPAFMSNINVYDVAAGKWYTQPTTGGPSQLTRGCAVMQPAQDYSSFNIYWYGGYNGLDSTDTTAFSDDVWILSLPTFMWMKVASGRSGYGRAGHKCVMPYPDQMMVVGGYPAQPGTSPSCVNGSIIELFNVSSSKWLDRYDPDVWSEYEVPSMIYQMIGGDESGGATSSTPSPTGWATTALASVFATSYPTSKITTYYPYAAATTNSSTLPTYTSSHSGSGSSVPKYLPPLLGVILGLIVVSAIVVGILLWRRRRYLKKNGGTSEVTDDNGNRILSWIRGQPSENKAPTVTTSDEVARSPEVEHAGLYAAHPYHHEQQQQQFSPQEMDNTQVAELMDTSPPAELSDTALTPVDIIRNHTRLGSGGNSSQGNPSLAYSSIAATDHASMVSSNSAAGKGALASSARNPASQPQEVAAAPVAQELDSTPNVPSTPTTRAAPRSESGVSAVSERDRAHLRQISDPATVSTMDGTIRGSPRLAPQQIGRVASPPIREEEVHDPATGGDNPPSGPTPVVSPPTEGEVEGEDYVSSRSRSAVVSPVQQSGAHGQGHGASNSPARRSIFRESREDMGGSN